MQRQDTPRGLAKMIRVTTDEGLIPMLIVLTVVLMLWTGMISNDAMTPPLRVGRPPLSAEPALSFPPPPPMLTRDARVQPSRQAPP